MLKRISQDATMFYVLNDVSLTVNYSARLSAGRCSSPAPSSGRPLRTFWMAFSKILPAYMAQSSDLAPVMTILPFAKMRAVVLGSLMRITTAGNLPGLYSALRQPIAILRKSNFRQFKSAVATRFVNVYLGVGAA